MDYATLIATAVDAGLDSAVIAKFALLAIVAQAVGRAIPDDKKGLLGAIRRVAKVVGMYIPNRRHSREEDK